MVSALLHLDIHGLPAPGAADLCKAAATLITRLHQQGVRPALLLQCSSAAEAAACLAVLQPAAEAAGAPFSLVQPSQLPVALRLGLDQLAPTLPPAIAVISLSDSSAAASLAASLGCGAVEHLPARGTTPPQLQAWGLQAVAGLAAARAAVRPLVVGYVMKESRQLVLAQQGMLPLLPVPSPAQQAAGGVAPAAATSSAGKAQAAAAAASSAGQAAGAAGQDPAMVFVPLDLGSSLPAQLALCQLVLQKLTDCLQPGGGGAVAELTPEAQALLALLPQGLQQGQQQQQGQRQQQQQQQQGQHTWPPPPPVCLMDPAESLQPIMDRAQLIPHLEQAALAVRQRAIPMRAPASLLLSRFDAAGTPRQLAAAGVGLPCIVKPQAACGVAEAHQMAFVLHSSGFDDLEVPLPAVAQEYVDHGGVVWKVYVAGGQVFWAQRKSTPDLGPLARRLAEDPEADIPSSIGFDSLQSLPTTLPWLRQLAAPAPAAAAAAAAVAAAGPGAAEGTTGGAGEQQAAAAGASLAQPAAAAAASGAQAALPPGYELMRRPTFEAVAAALRQQLGLTLFGFDLVFDRAAGELVIIDVNYFPSFKGIPEAPAALQAALRQRYAQHIAAWQAQQAQLGQHGRP
ncbi:hypothetical protein ABPG75_005616 [Micractinium tetrahymenae]